MSNLPLDLAGRADYVNVDDLLLNGRASEALQLAEQLPVLTPLHGRIRWHMIGQCFVQLGKLNEARAAMVKALESYGENIAVLKDLAAVFYQLGDIDNWKAHVAQFEATLVRVRSQLRVGSFIHAALMLGKFREELGEVASALRLYEQALSSCHSDAGMSLRYLVLPNLIRLKAGFDQIDGLGTLYAELISLRTSQRTFDLSVEMQHGLALAELRLVGPGQAWVRLCTLIEDERLSSADRRLLYYDFVEECMFQKHLLPESVLQWRGRLGSLDLFEDAIDRLAFAPHSSDWSLNLAGDLSFSCFLRIQMLRLGRAPEGVERAELKNQILLLVSGLDSDSRALWMGRLKPLLETRDMMLRYTKEARSLSFQAKHLDLSKRKSMARLMERLIEAGEVEVEAMIQDLWKSGYSLEHFHRLRMTVHRLNGLLFDLTAVPKVLDINSDRIALRPGVPIRLNAREI